MGKSAKVFLNHLRDANNDSNPELYRLALKLATGAGKTTAIKILYVAASPMGAKSCCAI